MAQLQVQRSRSSSAVTYRRWRPAGSTLGLAAVVGGALLLTILAMPAQAAIECAITPSTPGIIENTIRGTLPEAEAWDTVAIGTVIRLSLPRNDGYRRVDLRPEAIFRGERMSMVSFYYPLIDEGDGFRFDVGGRYFITAGHDNAYAPGLETNRCSATQPIDAGRALELIALGDPLIMNPIPGQVPWIPIGVLAGLALAVVTIFWTRIVPLTPNGLSSRGRPT